MVLPDMDFIEMSTILMGMLGIAALPHCALRIVEKVKGVA